MLVICPYPEGVAAGQRLKYEQYLDDWRAIGFDVDVAPFMDRKMWDVLYSRGHLATKVWGTIKGYVRRFSILGRLRRYDVVFIHMWFTPFGTAFMERVVRKLAPRIIFDVEDNVLTEQQSRGNNPNPVIGMLKGSGKARFLITNADHVITSSPYLNEYCAKLNQRQACTYISSSVDTDRFRPSDRLGERPDGLVTIGWTGTFSSREYLDAIAPMLQELASRVRYRLRIIGNFDYSLPGVDLEVVQWTAEHEVRDLQAIDIGLYPLPRNDWVLGKSGLKAIQYMAFGIPPVATDVGTAQLLIRDGDNGVLVRSDADWLKVLERLVQDAEQRKRLGAAARVDAVAKYSVAAIRADYRRVLADVTEERA
jgi:glycosyltransferase involved in cell wall biosynthesis